ncbi:hypothetical protein CHS0354_036361 [Potamilus streckersoni]|uniref:Ig-like domain-containing protein n=1 Tax=Potamilus streckersoni TaxID=2493646 RepID=A0AAE0SR81_9BIVA|nr:hypothetical protein CHS0354_036361 [Potamilus streckersoni]
MGPLLSPVLVIMTALYPINCGTLLPLIVSIDNGETLVRPLGSDAILTCSASGSGIINIVWIGPTGNTLTNNTKYTVTAYNINTGKSILTVFGLSTTDNGTYICRATDGSGSTAQDSISLSAYGTTGSGMTPSMTTSKKHIELTTPATATHNNATTPNNQTVSERLLSTIATDGSGSTAQDSISLRAYGTTGSGVTPSMRTSKQQTEMTTPATTTHNNSTTPNNQTVSERLLSTIVPLKVSIDNGKTMLKQVGSDAIIACSASGFVAINIVWIGPTGNTLTNNTKYTVTSYNINTGKSILTMFALSTTDNGSYKCRATDGFGSTLEDSISLTVYGTTGMTPNVTTSKQNMITITPTTATSTHIVPTTPNKQTVTERLVSTAGATGAGMAPELTTSKQNMTTITPAIATSTHYMVPTTPNNHTVIQRLVSTTDPLTVYIDDGETMFRQLGSDATITCSASGVGNITVVWIGPAWNTLTNNAKYTASSYNTKTGKSTLTIFALSTTDSGSYICLATDGSRSVYDSITLTANAISAKILVELLRQSENRAKPTISIPLGMIM